MWNLSFFPLVRNANMTTNANDEWHKISQGKMGHGKDGSWNKVGNWTRWATEQDGSWEKIGNGTRWVMGQDGSWDKMI